MSIPGNSYQSSVDPLDVVVEQALVEIQRVLGHPIGVVEQVAVARVLEQLFEDVSYHRRRQQ